MKKLIYLLSFSLLFANSIEKGIEAFKNKEYKKSFEIFQKLKTPLAYYYLGKQYYYGYGVKKNIQKSLEYLKKGCALNEPKACNGLGWIYQHKYNNVPLAVKYFKKACQLKYGKGCNNLGILYHNQKDYKNAVKYYKIACDLGYSWGCSNLGWYYENGKSVRKNLNIAKKLYEKACKIDKQTCISIGYFYKKNFSNYKKAIKYYKIACDNNDSMACNNLAWHYFNGKGVKKDFHKGYFYAKKAYKLNHNITLNLGYYYDHYVQDYKKAFKYYKIECENNNDRLGSIGCSNISWLVVSKKIKNLKLDDAKFYAKKAIQIDANNSDAYNDLGIYYKKIHNYKLAYTNFKKSCELGNKYGCYNLADLYENQNDYKKAMEFFKKACNLGNANGCNNIGYMYEIGKGIPRNYIKAASYYKEACNLGNKEECKKVAKLLKKACDLDNGLACNNLAILYTQNLKKPPSFKKISKLLKKACDLGNAAGCLNLGNYYAFLGKVSPNDIKKAIKYYNKACDLGSNEGCNKYKILMQNNY